MKNILRSSKMINRILKMTTLLFSVVLLSSCGGGGTQVAEGGIGGTGISTGTITAFGSIWVNGVEFSTAGAKFIEEDDEAGAIILNTNELDDPTELAPYLSEGMVVTINGTINDDGLTGTADTISYEDILEGPVVGNPVSGDTSFVALGQTVLVTTETQYDDGLFTVDDLEDRQVVEISGFRDASGNIHALYVAKQENDYTPSDIFEIKGIASVNSQYELQIGGLRISTLGRTQDVTVFAGKFVEAKGTFDGTDLLTASEDVEIEDESFDESDPQLDGYIVELEGLASTACGPTAPCEFEMSGVTVRVETTTTYSGTGSAVTDITTAVKLEAEGIIQNGKLIAESIEFE